MRLEFSTPIASIRLGTDGESYQLSPSELVEASEIITAALEPITARARKQALVKKIAKLERDSTNPECSATFRAQALRLLNRLQSSIELQGANHQVQQVMNLELVVTPRPNLTDAAQKVDHLAAGADEHPSVNPEPLAESGSEVAEG